jgi:phage protein U
MATIGTLGNIVFSASRSEIKTFDDMKWDSSAKYAQHERHLKDTLLEFVGTDPDKISFSMYFSVFLGINPIDEITKLLDAERNGEVMRLVIGAKAYGKDKWVIERTSKSLERFDNKGNLLIASVSVSLLAYVGR